MYRVASDLVPSMMARPLPFSLSLWRGCVIGYPRARSGGNADGCQRAGGMRWVVLLRRVGPSSESVQRAEGNQLFRRHDAALRSARVTGDDGRGEIVPTFSSAAAPSTFPVRVRCGRCYQRLAVLRRCRTTRSQVVLACGTATQKARTAEGQIWIATSNATLFASFDRRRC
jgi:hypothetical protein